MNDECLVLVKNQPNAKEAYNEALREMERDPFFCDDESVWIRCKPIKEGNPEIPDDPDACDPYGFQRVNVAPHDWGADSDHQPKAAYLTLPRSRKARDADETFFRTFEAHLDFFCMNDYSCAIVDPSDLCVLDTPSGERTAVIVGDPRESRFADEIRAAGPDDYLFFVNYHGF